MMLFFSGLIVYFCFFDLSLILVLKAVSELTWKLCTFYILVEYVFVLHGVNLEVIIMYLLYSCLIYYM